MSQIMKERKYDKKPRTIDDMTPSKNFIGIKPVMIPPGSINIICFSYNQKKIQTGCIPKLNPKKAKANRLIDIDVFINITILELLKNILEERSVYINPTKIF